MTTTQVVETSVTVNNNSPIQDYVHLDDQTQPIIIIIIIIICQLIRFGLFMVFPSFVIKNWKAYLYL